MNNNVYATPEANLLDTPTVEGFGSLERGIAGDYEFSIGATLREAWEKTAGSKWSLNMTATLYMVTYIIIAAVLAGISAVFLSDDSSKIAQNLDQLIQQLVLACVGAPLVAGLYVVGVRRAVNASVSPSIVFAYFSKTLPLFLTTLVMYLMILLGVVLLIIPGIYLMIAYMFAIVLVADKELSPWQALEASRKAISKRWFTLFGLLLVLGLINALTVVTLFIGTIWTLPMSIIAMGIAYRNMFGVEPRSLA